MLKSILTAVAILTASTAFAAPKNCGEICVSTPAAAAQYFEDARAAVLHARDVSKLIGVVKYDMDRGIVVLHRDGISKINGVSRSVVYKVLKDFNDRHLLVREVRVTDRNAHHVFLRMFNHDREALLLGHQRFDAVKNVPFPATVVASK